MNSTTRLIRPAAALAAVLGATLVAPPPAPAAGTQSVLSSNWAGYAVTGRTFRRVTGSWRVPTPTCSAKRTSASAWIGLGGYRKSSEALEQVGTDVDCSAAGHASYSAWYELVPAYTKTISMRIHPGDRMAGSVTVRGKRISVVLRNRTTGKRYAHTARMSAPDRTSAEWIVEAPESCASSCHELPLAKFAPIRFAGARATTTAGRRRSISAGGWPVKRLRMSQAASGSTVTHPSNRGARATSLWPGGTAFGVRYLAQSTANAKAATSGVASRKRAASGG